MSIIFVISYPVRDECRLQQWLQNIGRPNLQPREGHRVCSLHFTSDCIINHDDCKQLKKDAVPTVFGKRCIHAPQSADHSAPTSCSEAAIASFSLLTELQQQSHVVNTACDVENTSNNAQHSKASPPQHRTTQNIPVDHTYCRKLPMGVSRTKTLGLHNEHNYTTVYSPRCLKRQLVHTHSLLLKARHRQKLLRQSIRRLNNKIV